LLIYRENKQVKLPIVGIHGNHDYPMQLSKDSAYEMLSITKNISYIGKFPDLTKIVMRPTIFYKENIAIAVYGVGYIKDAILIPILTEGKYEVEPVPEEVNKQFLVFRILLFHQNRHKGDCTGAPNSIKYSLLPRGFDLVIWGHEHDCFTSLIRVEGTQTEVYQPGSSVATSFTDGEAIDKHVGVLEIDAKRRLRVNYCRLTTVRQMMVRERDYIYFKEQDNLERPKTEEQILGSIKDCILDMVKEANESSHGDYNRKGKLEDTSGEAVHHLVRGSHDKPDGSGEQSQGQGRQSRRDSQAEEDEESIHDSQHGQSEGVPQEAQEQAGAARRGQDEVHEHPQDAERSARGRQR
jgi:double-strand break repair protein MRE11